MLRFGDEGDKMGIPVPWGKSNGLDVPTPLIDHLLDTAATAAALWDLWLRPGLRSLLAQQIADGNESAARARIMLASGLHDLGKATSVFQGQQLTRPQDADLFRSLLREFEEAGFASLDLSLLRKESQELIKRHEAASLALLRLSGLPEAHDLIGDDWAATAVGGHHGSFLIRDNDPEHISKKVRDELEKAKGGKWGELQRELSAELERNTGAHLDDLHHDTGELTRTITLLTTGFVMVADWLASDSPCAPGTSFDDRLSYYRNNLTATIGLPVSLTDARRRLLGDYAHEPRPVQEIAEQSPGDLVVICDTTGSGKTEAALLRHSLFGDLGLMFALPTRATTNAMWHRMLKAYDHLPTAASLLHEFRSLDTFYKGPPNPDLEGIYRTKWLESSRHALLAPLSVGTIDQVLAGAIAQRHLPIRLLALANRHIVLDEVHTFDPYQRELLLRLLHWWGRTQTPVTMLSATLPEVDRERYVGAYHKGATPRKRANKEFDWSRKDNEPPELSFDAGSYPSITQYKVGQSPTEPHELKISAINSSRSYDLHYKVNEISTTNFTAGVLGVHARLRESDPQSCIGVIVNRVDTAIALGAKLRDSGEQLIVLHSRMTAGHRDAVSAEIAKRVGKEGSRGRLTIVGTQVLEASLDIDFDHLITELAPASSLIQRAGRLWRHSTPLSDGTWIHKGTRRSGDPTMHVVTRTMSDGISKDVKPYTFWETHRTHQALIERSGVLRIPDDVQQLVDQANFDISELNHHLTHDSDLSSVADALNDDRERVRAAGRVSVPFGTNDDVGFEAETTHGHLGTLTPQLRDLDPDDPRVTRFVDIPTSHIVLCDEGKRMDSRFFWQEEPLRAVTTRNPDEVRRVLSLSIPVSDTKLQDHLAEVPTRDTSNRAPRQKRIRLAALTPKAHYDPLLGLCFADAITYPVD